MADSAISPKPTGSTPQDVCTPRCLLDPIQKVFGKPFIDLAAHKPNVSEIFFTKEDDSLNLEWHKFEIPEGEHLWLNPSFALSKIFLQKCYLESSFAHLEKNKNFKIVAIVQTATSSKYWNKLIFNNGFCRVIFMEGRVPFEGYINKKTGKPMGANIDTSIIVYSAFDEAVPEDMRKHKMFTWKWREKNERPIPIIL